MDHIDEFESLFKSAERVPFSFQETPWDRITFITDLNNEQNERLRPELLSFLPKLQEAEQFTSLGQSEFNNVVELLDLLRQKPSDLLITYRHLFEEALIPQHSLGVYVDVLTQISSTPVLLLPGTGLSPVSLAEKRCLEVLVVTDHISGDDRLINLGAACTPDSGKLILSHIEDKQIFERYMATIEQIPEIGSTVARDKLLTQLLKNADDYIAQCEEVFQEIRPELNIEPHTSCGHPLNTLRGLVEEHEVDLIVANTKEDEQLAMHGLTYSLSIEFNDIPLLLL